MADAAASAAARELSRARWGSTRVDRLLSELAAAVTAEKLTDAQRAALREVTETEER
jgi:hypothetical protein